MGLSPRIVLFALLLLVLPAAFTAVFLARHARPAVEAGAQPGGAIEGRLAPREAGPAGTRVDGVALEIAGVALDGTTQILARGTTTSGGHFVLEVPPIDGHYEIRVVPGPWHGPAAPVSLLDTERNAPLDVPVYAAARLELKFARRSGAPVRGGAWSLDGELGRSWFSSWSGRRFERDGTFAGPELVVEGLPPIRARVVVRLDGGDRAELVVDLAAGPNRHTVEL